jgi:glycosyltransferase involved in cell wall biosynthesis
MRRRVSRQDELPSKVRDLRALLYTWRQLLVLDKSGLFISDRVTAELNFTTSTRARMLLSVVPIGSRRFRLVITGIRELTRLANFIVARRDKRPLQISEDAHVTFVRGDQRPLHFSPSSHSSVVVIIPVHNNWAMTEACLRSLVIFPSQVPIRLLVVDDASSDETPERLAGIEGLEVLTLKENVGFLRAVHAGISSTTEELIVLLNNDTIVTEGWLDALVATMTEQPSVGIAGSILLYINGLLQEAGSVIFSDGTGVNVGKGDFAHRDWYQTPHDVDYCSGASIMIRRSVWDATGGFDLAYAPAYYEETDLSFAARRAGYRVVLQPQSRIFHVEGGTYGTDESPRKRELMDRNRTYFTTKWASEMSEQWTAERANWVGASWRDHRGRILVVDSVVPTPDQDAGSIRMTAILKILQEMGYAVTFLSIQGGLKQPYTDHLRQLGIEVLDGRLHYASEIARIGDLLVAVILSRPRDARLVLSAVKKYAPQAPIIYDTVDLHYVREGRRAAIENSAEIAALADEYQRLEFALMRDTDATLVTTKVEAEALELALPECRIEVLSTIHSPSVTGGERAARRDLLFVGNFDHLPNRDGIKWFVSEVLPRLRSLLPEIHINIVGSNMPPEIQSLDGAGVNVIGWVQDLAPLYDAAKVVIAPLRYGAGIKGKIGESAMHGVPVVATTIASEGINLLPERDFLLADEPRDFATQIARVYDDTALWEALSTNSQTAISAQCSPEVARQTLEQLFTVLGLTGQPIRR